MKKLLLSAGLLLALPNLMNAQFSSYWQKHQGNISVENRRITPQVFEVVDIDNSQLWDFLNKLSNDFEQAKVIALPNPDGTTTHFNIWKTSIMEPALQAKFPQIQTFTASQIDNPNVTAKLDYTSTGFHAMIYDGDNTYFIDPINYLGDSKYQVYYKKNYDKSIESASVCEFDDDAPRISDNETTVNTGINTANRTHGTQRKTYRLALSCTGEYAVAVAGASPTKAAVLSAMTTTLNRVNGIYEREIAVTMVLIANNDDIIYTNKNTDPFSYNNFGSGLLSENQSNTTSVIGSSNYDIGHIFSTGGGGIASLGSVCYTSQKAMGVTGSSSPTGDGYDVDYVAHEMGHQFGGNHTFNNCGGNENASTAYEPGSGSTIMAYAGICGSTNNLQAHSDDYFHAATIIEITDNLQTGTASTCGTATTGHVNLTTDDITGTYTVPAQCAIELTAPTATWSVSGGSINYNWEEWDKGNLRSPEPSGATMTLAPVFRSLLATEDPTRSFPNRDSVLKNKYSYKGERTPQESRNMRYGLTTRGIGPDAWGTTTVSDNLVNVSVYKTGSIFTVTYPNSASDELNTNRWYTITWDPAGSNTAPINATTVDVLLSVDGGKTYPYTLASNTANNGSAVVMIPDGATTYVGRIKVKGHNNVFYDVSNNNFKITYVAPNSIDESAFSKQFKVYPNPTTNIVNINAENNAAYQVIIFNITGQQLNIINFENNAAIQLDAYASGLYLLEVTDTKTGDKALYKIAKK